MAKRPDVESSLPRSWEMRYNRTAPWEDKTSYRLKLYQKAMDPFVDLNFNIRRIYRNFKADYGYLAGPILFGIPFCCLCMKGLKSYQTKLDAGKIKYRYRSPEHLRIPPADIAQQPPWNSEHIAPLRQPETLSQFQVALETGSRMVRGNRMAQINYEMLEERAAREQQEREIDASRMKKLER